MLVRKTIFGGIESVGGSIVTAFTGGTRYDIIASGRLQAGEDLYVTGHMDIVDNTSEVTFEHGIFRVSLVGGTTLFRLTDLDGMDVNNDFTMGIGKTLKVDIIERADSGLGYLQIEDIAVDGAFLYTDNIAERTTGNGIRIDLLKVKDNTIDLISGTEVIFEKKVRIRDPLYLECSHIREADLSSGVHIDDSVYLQYTDTYTRLLRIIGDGRLAGTTAVYYMFDNDSNPASTTVTLFAFDCEVLHLDLIQNTGGGSNTRIYNVELDHFESFNCPRTFSIITEADLTPTANGTIIVRFLSAANNIIATFTNGPGTTKKYYETQLAWLGTAWAVVSNTETTTLVL